MDGLELVIEILFRWTIFTHRVYRLIEANERKDLHDIVTHGFLLIFIAMVFWSQTGTILFPAK